MIVSDKLVVLDRDGVINKDSSEYIKSIEDWKLYESAVEAIRVFNKLQFKVVIATNQSGISRGFYNIELLLKINLLLQSKLYAVGAKIDSIFFCPHLPENKCLCRKPRPGMLNEISSRYSVNPNSIHFFGDSYKDFLAAKNIGAKFTLIDTKKPSISKQFPLRIPIFKTLHDAAISYKY
jgi:D-glycero-D-manno-heptose 1,7-bisphosphate phosphatase